MYSKLQMEVGDAIIKLEIDSKYAPEPFNLSMKFIAQNLEAALEDSLNAD